MRVYGYARVSTRGQNYETQEDQIKAYCKFKECELIKIFADKKSGKDMERKEFSEMVGLLTENPFSIDAVVVTKLDRVGRSIRDLLKFIDFLESKKIGFVATLSNIDTTTKEGRLFFYIMGALSEYERELILERTEAGRQHFIEKGGKFGPKHIKEVKMDELYRQKATGVPISQIAKKMRVHRSTLYRRMNEDGGDLK